VWDKAGNKMYYPFNGNPLSVVWDKVDGANLVQELADKDGSWACTDKADEYEIMQHTGFVDASESDIYHRDIIVSDRFPFSDGYIATVEWIDGAWQYILWRTNANRHSDMNGYNYMLAADGEDVSQYRVIGNAYENRNILPEYYDYE